MMTKYKKAYGVLKTEPEMRRDYGIAKYPYDKSIYDYFVSLNQNNKPPNNTQAQSSKVDMYGRIKPNDDIVSLGKELRELFDKNRYR